MVLFRALGWVLLALALGVVVYDGLAWWSDGRFHMLALGDLWSRLDPASLDALQRRLSGSDELRRLLPILRVPALAVLAIVGLLCLLIGRRGGGPGRPSFPAGNRRSRRRRGGGLS